MCLSNVRRRILNLINHPATCSLIIIVVIIRPPYKLCIPTFTQSAQAHSHSFTNPSLNQYLQDMMISCGRRSGLSLVPAHLSGLEDNRVELKANEYGGLRQGCLRLALHR